MLVAMVCGSFAAASAFAEDVPLPTPAPLPKTGAVPPSAVQRRPEPMPPRRSGAAPADGGQHGFFPFSFPFDKGAQPRTGDRVRRQAARAARRVSLYLSSMQTLVGNFVQIAPDGSRTEGTFYIQKPGKVRFDYNPPSPIDVIADGSSVVVRNAHLDTQDL